MVRTCNSIRKWKGVKAKFIPTKATRNLQGSVSKLPYSYHEQWNQVYLF